MTALLSAQLLKLRTTRASFGLAVALLLISSVAAAGSVATAGRAEMNGIEFQQDLPLSGGFATLFALLFGLLVVTAEYRHGTITATFLVTPVRERVIAAMGLSSAIAGAALALVALAVVYAVGAPWLAGRGAELHLLDGEAPRRMLGVVAAAALWGVLGVGVGSLVRNQVAAIVGVLAWFLILEPLVALLVDEAAPYLPGAAADGLMRSDGQTADEDLLSPWAAFGITLGYAVVALGVGAVAAARRDVT